MKTIIKIIAIFLVVLFTAFAFENGNASNTNIFKKASCPRTLTFCIPGAGSGVPIQIYLSGDCTGKLIATIYTGSNGCVQYTFTSNCDRTHSCAPVCSGPSGDICVYFVPDNIDNVGVTPCPK